MAGCLAVGGMGLLRLCFREGKAGTFCLYPADVVKRWTSGYRLHANIITVTDPILLSTLYAAHTSHALLPSQALLYRFYLHSFSPESCASSSLQSFFSHR